MARENTIRLYGYVKHPPLIGRDANGKKTYVMASVVVIRGPRKVGDHKKYAKKDCPILLTSDEDLMDQMEQWKEHSIVDIKGVVSTRNINKGYRCKHCGSPNFTPGVFTYITPIFVRLDDHKCESLDECIEYIQQNREISNEAKITGTVCIGPKKTRPKEGLVVTQYTIAVNRKYRVRTDSAEIESDYPVVKSYGKNALEDRKRLHVGSLIQVDGCIQTRRVEREVTCKNCGKKYMREDTALELVPFDVEYLRDYYSDEIIEEMKATKTEDAMAKIFGPAETGTEEDTLTEEDYEAGFDDDAD